MDEPGVIDRSVAGDQVEAYANATAAGGAEQAAQIGVGAIARCDATKVSDIIAGVVEG